MERAGNDDQLGKKQKIGEHFSPEPFVGLDEAAYVNETSLFSRTRSIRLGGRRHAGMRGDDHCMPRAWPDFGRG